MQGCGRLDLRFDIRGFDIRTFPFDRPLAVRYTAVVDDAKLTAAVAGNARARAAVLRSLQDGWFRYAVANLLSVSAARDATQEAGLRVLQRLSSYDRAEPVEAWSLGGVVAAVREVRALNGAPPPLLATARRAGLSAAPPRFDRQVADVADGLSAVLSTLTDEQREAVVLRVVRRRTAAETAAAIGVDPAVAGGTVRAGLRAIRRSDEHLRTTVETCRDWSDLARYPGNLQVELFRAHKPGWLVPAAVGTLAASVVLVAVAGHYRSATPAATTRPATRAR